MKIFYGTKALWVSFICYHCSTIPYSLYGIVPVFYTRFQLPNTNFSKEKIDTDRITDRYVWKATRRRLDEHYSHPVALGRPTEPDWPGDYNRPIPDDNIQFEDESNSIAPLLHRSRKRPSHTDPTKDEIIKTRKSHSYFFTFLDQAQKYKFFKGEGLKKKFENLSKSIYQEVKKVFPEELTPEEELKKRQDEEKRLEDKKRKFPEEVKDGWVNRFIKDLKVDEKGEGSTEGEPPKKKQSPSSSSVDDEQKNNMEAEDGSDSEEESSGSSVPLESIQFQSTRDRTNPSFFQSEEPSEEAKSSESLTPEEIETVDIFLGELEYFQNFFNLNEYDKRAGE